ncbi:MAG: hypothetical protein R3234_13845, partial [Thermoanaerobaculia bacterium]|nr:hypothetical protein [Thermoanaerobaculia bacterium]
PGNAHRSSDDDARPPLKVLHHEALDAEDIRSLLPRAPPCPEHRQHTQADEESEDSLLDPDRTSQPYNL